MLSNVKAMVVEKVNKAYLKVMPMAIAASTAVCTLGMSASAEEGATGATGGAAGLSAALSGVDTGVILEGFYAVLPVALTVALPIIGAKVGLNFLFGSVKGA